MAPAQGWHAQIEKCIKFFLILTVVILSVHCFKLESACYCMKIWMWLTLWRGVWGVQFRLLDLLALGGCGWGYVRTLSWCWVAFFLQPTSLCQHFWSGWCACLSQFGTGCYVCMYKHPTLSWHSTVTIKRPALQQQPDLYLEPKWLRWFLLWSASTICASTIIISGCFLWVVDQTDLNLQLPEPLLIGFPLGIIR